MTKRASKRAASADKQRRNSGERAEGGKFAPGNSLAWKPGESGNPAGRPKSITLSEALRRELAKDAPATEGAEATGDTYAERIAAVLCAEAARGNVRAATEIADRTEGRPRQAVEVDMNVRDWRERAKAAGIPESDVIAEARRMLDESEPTIRRSTRTGH